MAETLKSIPLNSIEYNDRNLRTDGTEDYEDLADSIAFIGLLEPPVVKKNGDVFTLVAGERRVRACELLVRRGDWEEFAEIKCIVRTGLTDEQVMSAFLIENMQRVDLTPVEQAEGVVALITEHGMSEADIAKNLGVNKQWVKDRIGIHQLPDHVKPHIGVRAGGMPVAHAGMLAALPQDYIDRLTKDDKVPGQYDIETAASKVRSQEQGDKILQKLKKTNVLVTTEKELKRIVKSDIGGLSGDDWTIKSMLGDAEEVVTDYWRTPEHSLVMLDRLFKFDGTDVDMKTIYVQRRVGGFIEWAKAVVKPGKGKENPNTVPDEADEYDEMEARNDERRKDYELARRAAEAKYVEDAKPADLIAVMLWDVIMNMESGFRSHDRMVDVCQRLGLDYADIDRDVEHGIQRENHEKNLANVVVYANKNAANLARAAATCHMVTDRHNHKVEYPDPPEYEIMDEEDEDDLIASGF
jgi:ParB/RepB/Spo0J family partition protein